MGSKDMVRVECNIDRDTDKAVLIKQEDPSDSNYELEFWIPKSQIDKTERGDTEYGDQIWIPKWLAESKDGLEFVDA